MSITRTASNGCEGEKEGSRRKDFTRLNRTGENTYGGLYTAIASLDLDLRTVVVLTGDGVYSALRGQSGEKSLGYPTIGNLFHQIHPRAKIYAESSSLSERGLEKTDLIETVEPIEDRELFEVFVKYGEAIITY